jgi:hypothetical protein
VPTKIFQAFPLMSEQYCGDPKTRGHFLSVNVIYIQFLRIPNVHTVKMSLYWGAEVWMMIILYKKMTYASVGADCEMEWDDTMLWKMWQCGRTSCAVIVLSVSQLRSICELTARQWTCVYIIEPTRCTDFTNLFCHETLHVSDSSSVHHQEFIHCTLSNGKRGGW